MRRIDECTSTSVIDGLAAGSGASYLRAVSNRRDDVREILFGPVDLGGWK
jgi:hypothetical protein